MRVISFKALRDFWAVHPDAESPLRAWHTVAAETRWRHFADVRATFNTADLVGDCVVFDIGGNKYRLIGRVRYARGALPGVVYVLKVMTHKVYDENKWPADCGCYAKPPKKPIKRAKKKRQ